MEKEDIMDKQLDVEELFRLSRRRYNKMTKNMFQKFRETVYLYVIEHMDKTDNAIISVDDVYIVWCCKTLQNWKALISTTLPDGMYYECTYNGDKDEMYLDAYKKFDNKVYPDFKDFDPED